MLKKLHNPQLERRVFNAAKNNFSTLTGKSQPDTAPPLLYHKGLLMRENTKKFYEEGKLRSKTFFNVASRVENIGEMRQKKLDGISPEHDLNKIPGYRKAFTQHYLPKLLESEAETPHYNPHLNYITTKRSLGLGGMGHELDHMANHLTGAISASSPEERLASEHSAFHTQLLIMKEDPDKKLTRKLYENIFDGRDAREMAKSYEGKSGYPGTLESSTQAVRERHIKAGYMVPALFDEKKR